MLLIQRTTGAIREIKDFVFSLHALKTAMELFYTNGKLRLLHLLLVCIVLYKASATFSRINYRCS